MNKRMSVWVLLALSGLLLACNLLTPTTPPDYDTDNLYTQAAQTVVVELTENAPLATATAIVVVPDDTAVPTAIFTQIPTAMPIPTSTSVPLVCDAIQFISDVSVSDGTAFTPGSKFIKTWRLKNVGQCTWTADYDLIFMRGDQLGAQAVIPLGVTVTPGKTIDIHINFEAPDDAGKYKGYWALRNSSGIAFGLGGNIEKPFWLDIRVIEANANYAYDFAINYCQATWRTDMDGKLPCPGDEGAAQGFVMLLSDPDLENKRENEPTLWVHPNTSVDGWIRGIYPAFKVKKDDHFVAWVGCLDDSKGCNVTFKLQYRIGTDKIETLGAWGEVFDDDITKIDLDLSSLAGKNVQFILRVNINGGKPANANAFWFVPHIER